MYMLRSSNNMHHFSSMTFQARWVSARNTPSSSWPSPRVSARAWNPSSSWWAWSRTCALGGVHRGIFRDFWGFSLGKWGISGFLGILDDFPGGFDDFPWGLGIFALDQGDLMGDFGWFFARGFWWPFLEDGWFLMTFLKVDFLILYNYPMILNGGDGEFHGDDWCLLGLFIGDWMGF